jgi:hypothetical protein
VREGKAFGAESGFTGLRGAAGAYGRERCRMPFGSVECHTLLCEWDILHRFRNISALQFQDMFCYFKKQFFDYFAYFLATFRIFFSKNKKVKLKVTTCLKIVRSCVLPYYY